MNDPGAGERSGTLRLFIAIELPEDVLRVVAEVAAALRRLEGGRGVRWVAPGSVHLTLKFVGTFPDSQRPALESALAGVAAAHPPFGLETGAVGGFGSPARLRVIWLGVGGDIERCAALAAALDRATARFGVERATRPLAPHLTLGRVGNDAPAALRRRLSTLCAAVPAPVSVGFRVRRVSLMRSWLLPGGARHEAVRRFELTGQPAPS